MVTNLEDSGICYWIYFGRRIVCKGQVDRITDKSDSLLIRLFALRIESSEVCYLIETLSIAKIYSCTLKKQIIKKENNTEHVVSYYNECEATTSGCCELAYFFGGEYL